VDGLGSRLNFFNFEDVTISLSVGTRNEAEVHNEGTINGDFEWDEHIGTVHIPRLSSLGEGEQRLTRVEEALKALKPRVDQWRDNAALTTSHLRKLFDRVESIQHRLGVPVRISTELRGDKKKQLEGLDNLMRTVQRYPSIAELSSTSLTLVIGDNSADGSSYSVNLSKRVLKIPCDFEYSTLVEFLKQKVLLPLTSTSQQQTSIKTQNLTKLSPNV